MPLPTPNLDDRRFQDLVDDAKRLVQQRCPEWTDHNVSDPGVTLIETFASMVDQLLYRLNRVPAANYLRYLDLLGVRLFPPTAAHVDLTFWLSAAQADVVRIPLDTQVATVRTDAEEPVVFTVARELPIVPCSLDRVMTVAAGAEPVDRTDALSADHLACFSARPAPDDAVLFGLTEAVPSCAVLLRLDCEVEGVGVDPRDPPLVWEAWTEAGWVACQVDEDGTGGLNRPGDVILHVPAAHAASILGRRRAGWLRCRVVHPAAGQPFYSASPRIRAAEASTIGGTVEAVHAEVIRDETVGLSEGVAGQRFGLRHRPVVPTEEPPVLEISGGQGWDEWRAVETFAHSAPDDRHFQLDWVAGEVVFGPAVREPDGTLRQHGAVPPKAAAIRIPAYRTGGGRRGNVARGLLKVQREPVPFVSRVENQRAATGGVDGESVDEAAVRGPLALRTRDRAVTAEDYEQLAREAAPDVARVRCVAADEDPAAGIRVLVVPAAELDESAQMRFADLVPSEATLGAISRHLDARRCVGARVVVEPPFYQGVTVVVKLTAKRRTVVGAVQDRALDALNRYLNPLVGGPDGTGWPFGRPVQSGEIFAVLQGISGVELVDEVRLFGADPITGERGGPEQRVDVPANALVFSYEHQVRVSA